MAESVLENRRFQKSLFRIVSFPLVFLLVVLAFFHYQNSYRDSLTDEISESDEVRLLMTQLKGQLLLVDSGISHFVLSGNKVYVAEARSSYRSAKVTAQLLKKKFATQPMLGGELESLLLQVDTYISGLQKIYQSRDKSQSLSDANKATQMVEKYRQIFNDLLETHESILQSVLIDRQVKVKKLSDAKQLTLILEIIFIIFVCFSIFFIISVQLKKVVSSYRKLLTKYEESLNDLTQSLKAKDLFLANMSHELRTPLGAITGFVELATEQPDLSPDMHHHLQYIKRNSEHLLALIDDLFDVSRLNADKLEVHQDKTDILTIVEDVQHNYSSRILDNRVEVSIDMDEKVPRRVLTDSIRFKQILSNLTGNAIKFSNAGDTVKIKFSYFDKKLVVDVIDTGIGIDKKNHDRIFSAFSQVETEHSREYGGAGLGLSISKKLAVALGGDLKLVDSMIGKGSHFRLQLPAKPVGDELIGQPFAKKDRQATLGGKNKRKRTFDFKGKRILLAEDSKENQILFKIFIESSNADLDIVDNGTDAVKKALSEEFDLVLMDIQMPGLDGYEAVKILRRSHYQKKILALTAHTLKGERERCLQAGFDNYLTKPISQQDLLAAVERSLSH